MSQPESDIDEGSNKFTTTEFCKQYLRWYQTKQIIGEEKDASPDRIDDEGFPMGQFYLPRCIKWLHDEFASGRHMGTRLLDICCGPSILPALVSSKIFEEIIMADLNHDCLQEISKWVRCDTEANDWRPFSEYIAALERNVTPQWLENRTRKAIKRTIQFDIRKEIPLTGDFLPVDCITGILALPAASDDRDLFMKNMKKAVSWLKPGGTIILVLGLNVSSFTLFGVKYNITKLSLDYILKCFSEVGLKDVSYKVHPAAAGKGLVDDRKYAFLSAVY